MRSRSLVARVLPGGVFAHDCHVPPSGRGDAVGGTTDVVGGPDKRDATTLKDVTTLKDAVETDGKE